MADIASTIETLENQLMRAWIKGDIKDVRGLIARNFNMLVAGKISVGLDRASFLTAIEGRFTCTGYRLKDVYVRKHGSTVMLSARCDLEMKLDGGPWSGSFWLVDLWRKSSVRRKWQLVERTLSRTDEDGDIPAAIRSLQLWR